MKRRHKFLAFIRRTFVTHCPKCGQHFYGFHDYVENVTIKGVHYRYVCHRCAKAAAN